MLNLQRIVGNESILFLWILNSGHFTLLGGYRLSVGRAPTVVSKVDWSIKFVEDLLDRTVHSLIGQDFFK